MFAVTLKILVRSQTFGFGIWFSGQGLSIKIKLILSMQVCQLRLDFVSMSGYLTSTTAGACLDTFAAAGQTGVNPPTICGTNTGYHMYVEFGTSSSDSVTLTNTWSTAGLATAKNYNILARQIGCNDDLRYKIYVYGCSSLINPIVGLPQTVSNTSPEHQTMSKAIILTERSTCRV